MSYFELFTSKSLAKAINILLKKPEINISELRNKAGFNSFTLKKNIDILVKYRLVNIKKFGRITILESIFIGEIGQMILKIVDLTNKIDEDISQKIK